MLIIDAKAQVLLNRHSCAVSHIIYWKVRPCAFANADSSTSAFAHS